MDPPPPSAPRLSPISRPTGTATINTAGTAPHTGPCHDAEPRGGVGGQAEAPERAPRGRGCASGDGPGPSALGDDREAGGRPGPHPTGQVEHGVPVGGENPCGAGGSVPGPAHRD